MKTIFLLLLISSGKILATTLPMPHSIAQEILSENVPTAFSADSTLEATDYSVEWAGPAIPGITASLGKKSLQWVRVLDVLTLPRARLLIDAVDIEAGHITHAGFTQVFSNNHHAELPVALISSEQNSIYITIRRNNKELRGQLQVKLRSRSSYANQSRVFLDPSCSKFQVETISRGARSDEWAYLGCRLVLSGGNDYRTSTLEIYVFWDNVGQNIEVNKIKTGSTLTSIWPLRLSAQNSPVTLKADHHELEISYQIAERLKRGALGLGVGPYATAFQNPTEEKREFSPLMTLYAGYLLTDSTRLTAFDATSFGPHGFTDFGVYLNTENIRAIDHRLAINFLLGAHVLGFSYQGRYYVKPSAPQGIELIYTDAFKPGYNLSLGGFLYPKIQGTSYTNLWLRWGGKVFVEFNLISWDETANNENLFNQSYGLTFGFPLVRFL